MYVQSQKLTFLTATITLQLLVTIKQHDKKAVTS